MVDTDTLDIAFVRSHFPALTNPALSASGKDEYIFADNAGGSQCLTSVADAVRCYLLNSDVQLGADYSISVTSTKRVMAGVEAARDIFNAESVDEIVLGSCSSLLVENLSRGLEDLIEQGDEIIITGEHECTSVSSSLLIKPVG